MTEVNELPAHTPAPGSRIDRAASAAAQATPDPAYVAAAQAGAALEEPRISPVPVTGTIREERAAHTTYRTVVIPSASFQRLLGRNDSRRSAVLSCVSGVVVLSASFELAGEVNNAAPGATPGVNLPGAWLASGTPGAAIPLEGTEEVWGTATSTAAAAVAIIEEWWE